MPLGQRTSTLGKHGPENRGGEGFGRAASTPVQTRLKTWSVSTVAPGIFLEDIMHAMVLKTPGAALEWRELADRQPGPGEIRLAVAACGVCRTDLHVLDGDLPDPKLPI